MINNKKSYIEPKDAPPGVPCRFCDMPSGVDGLGPVLQDGKAVDGHRPLFSHGYCLMNSGGKKQDNEDFSLQNLLPQGMRSRYDDELKDNNQQFQMAASIKPEEESIWSFATKNRFIAHPEPNNLTKTKKPPKVEDATRENASEQYSDESTGSPQPPSI